MNILTTTVMAQDPLQSRFYKKDNDVIRYEANLALDIEMLKLYIKRDPVTNELIGCSDENDNPIKTISSLENALIKTSFSTSTENITCDSFIQGINGDVSNQIPTGFGGLSFGSFNGGAEAKATLLRYNIHYSSRGFIPFYILATTTAGNNLDADNVKTNLFGTNSGLLNFKMADDVYTFNAHKKNGFCNFVDNPFLSGGCYLNYQLGAKMIGYTDENGKTDNLVAGYSSIQFAVDLPITQTKANVFSRAGRLVAALGLSAYYANTEKVQNLFPEFKDSEFGKVEGLNEFYSSVDAGVKFTLTNVVDINLSASFPLVNKKVYDNNVSISIVWYPDN